MKIEEYVRNNQITVDIWKNRFNCLFYWNIKYIYDGETWSQTRYDIKNRMAIIYPCDIDVENNYIIYEVIKLAFIASDGNMNDRLELISDLVAIVVRNGY